MGSCCRRHKTRNTPFFLLLLSFCLFLLAPFFVVGCTACAIIPSALYLLFLLETHLKQNALNSSDRKSKKPTTQQPQTAAPVPLTPAPEVATLAPIAAATPAPAALVREHGRTRQMKRQARWKYTTKHTYEYGTVCLVRATYVHSM